MLKCKDISKYYSKDGVIAKGITKVNLELFLGEFVVITGESGSGKSTLLNVLSGLDTYEDGEMYINGEETSHYTEEDYLEYRRKYVSNIFQNFNLVNSYTVYENIELAMLMNGKCKHEVKKYINELINKVGLKKYRNTVVSKLSGGQKQRVAIARALANDTPIIVADEPTGALDREASKSILKLLHEISKDKLIIVVTHNKAEIEEYATRLIRMHDGRILENKVIEKINLDDSITSKEIKDITPISKMRLGIRNTFNIPTKFILMFIIFLLISITLISNYGILKNAEYEESNYGYSQYFMNDSDLRIIIKKKNNYVFEEADYDYIKAIDNVDYIVSNDLINDSRIYLSSNRLYLSGQIISQEISKVDEGRLPKNSNELVVLGSKDNYYLSDLLEEVMDDTYYLENISNVKDKKIVGVVYTNDDNKYGINSNELAFYLNNDLYNEISLNVNKDYTDLKVILNKNNFYNSSVYPSKKVNDGEVYVREDYSSYCNDGNCLNDILTVNVSNFYYSEELNLKVASYYNKDNLKKILDIDYDELSNEAIIISENDFAKLYNKGNYQSSVFIKNIEDLDKTVDKLNNMGYSTLAIKNAKTNDLETILQIFKIFRLIITLVLVFTLFFISYFIIKIIYKSRNSYYTTLRTLGGTKKVCINILMKELFMHATFAYSLFLIFIYLVNIEVIKFPYFKLITKYVGLNEYILVYLILIILSVLIALRYGRKIFKDSIIKTYGERL